jgi:hypothetical protein
MDVLTSSLSPIPPPFAPYLTLLDSLTTSPLILIYYLFVTPCLIVFTALISKYIPTITSRRKLHCTSASAAGEALNASGYRLEALEPLRLERSPHMFAWGWAAL